MSLERRQGYWLWTGGPVPPGAAGTTIGRVIIVRRAPSDRLLRHELVHVAQFDEMGIVPFVASYTWQYLRWRARGYPHKGAYRRISYEVEAYWLERIKAPQRDSAAERCPNSLLDSLG